MADYGLDGLTSMSATSYNVAGLTSMPGYDLKIDFGFNGCQRLRWLDFDAWLQTTKWLQRQWLAAASMARLHTWLRGPMTLVSMAISRTARGV